MDEIAANRQDAKSAKTGEGEPQRHKDTKKNM
jgi:hypothetical protein